MTVNRRPSIQKEEFRIGFRDKESGLGSYWQFGSVYYSIDDEWSVQFSPDLTSPTHNTSCSKQVTFPSKGSFPKTESFRLVWEREGEDEVNATVSLLSSSKQVSLSGCSLEGIPASLFGVEGLSSLSQAHLPPFSPPSPPFPPPLPLPIAYNQGCFITGPLSNFKSIPYAYSSANLPGIRGLSLSVWVNRTTSKEGDRLLEFYNSSENRFSLLFENGGVIYSVRKNGTSYDATASSSLFNDNQWTHIGLIHYSNETAVIYLNGEETGRNDGIPIQTDDYPKNRMGYIGRSKYGSPDLIFSGQMKDMIMFDYALTQDVLSEVRKGEGGDEFARVSVARTWCSPSSSPPLPPPPPRYPFQSGSWKEVDFTKDVETYNDCSHATYSVSQGGSSIRGVNHTTCSKYLMCQQGFSINSNLEGYTHIRFKQQFLGAVSIFRLRNRGIVINQSILESFDIVYGEEDATPCSIRDDRQNKEYGCFFQSSYLPRRSFWGYSVGNYLLPSSPKTEATITLSRKNDEVFNISTQLQCGSFDAGWTYSGVKVWVPS